MTTMKRPLLGVLLSALALGVGDLILDRVAILPALADEGPSTPVLRFEQGDPAVSYSGAWSASSHSQSFSGGDAVLSMDTGARATLHADDRSHG